MSIIDEHEEIRRRMEELRAAAQESLTGTSAPVTGQEPKIGEYAVGWPYTASADYDPA
ncbi:hypothetical protein V1290_000038 [Bradyrhizobium sp. AZCC 1578]|uniref:hypothetical protein n=1 Tax=Bradyrhizobium sp. AZCC 1578 TaxID=3117027 RepID=UPI002FEFC3A1